jgi:hypothetical protein
MNTVLNAPAWATAPATPGTAEASLRQLVNAAGPLAGGIATALTVVQRAQIAEDDGEPTPLDADQRAKLLAMCAVAAQLLEEVALDACNDLVGLSG